MTRNEKCEAIVRRILGICNEGHVLSFEEDMGGNTLTILREDRGHTHVGIPGEEGDDEGFDVLVNNLYDTLHDGPGLSWC